MKFILPSVAKDPNLNPQAFKGLKTVKIAQERRLISGTALLQPLEFILSFSLLYSSFYISYAEISCGCCPFVFPRIALFLCPPTTHLSLHCLLDSSPPSILISKYPFSSPCFFLFFTVNLSSSVSPSLFLSCSLSIPPSLSEVREGASVPGEMLLVVGGRGEGGRGTDLVRG